MIRRAAIFASCLALGCAESIPGVDPPGDEVFFPIGVTVIPDATGQPLHLAVLSSNFDQRYNSGRVTAYSIDALFALSTCDPATETEPCIHDSGAFDIRGAQTDTVRVFSFGGDLVWVPKPGDPTKSNLFVAARGRNRLTMIDVDTAPGGDLLNCATPGGELAVGSDCSRAYAADTGYADPLGLVYAPASGGRPDSIGIAHVGSREDGGLFASALALADVATFRERPMQEIRGEETTHPIVQNEFRPFGGFSGIAYAGDVLGSTDVFLATDLRATPDVALAAYTTAQSASGLYGLVEPGELLFVSSEIGAVEMRALVVAPDSRRAYVSMRFFAPGDSYNAGIAVIDLTQEQMQVIDVLEFGDELQRPFLREVTVDGQASRYIYVGDIRRDKLYIIDVTTDSPILVKEIDGRGTRTIEGQTVQARLLDSPSQIAFATRNGRSLGFVTNFSNSTLAVLDVTDPDPRMHRIVARLGRNIDPEGEMEKP